jgi:hypothetical protein
MKKTPWILGGLLMAVGLMWGMRRLLPIRPGASDEASGAPINASNAPTAGEATSPATAGSPGTPDIQALLRAAHEAIEAEKRGEDLGTTPWSKTPEDVLDAVFNRFDEPFQPLVLERLAKALPNLKSPTDRVKAAALLHRYGHAAGTAFLREWAARTEEGSSLAATVLAKTRDAASIPLLVQRLDTSEWNQLEIPLLEALGAWDHPQLNQALARRAARAEPNQAWVARALVTQGAFDAWDRLPASSLETMRSFPTDRLDLEAVSARRGNRPAPEWGDRLFAGLRQDSTLPDTGILGSARLAGPVAVQESLERFLNGYIDHKTRWNSTYQEHVAAIQNGTKEWSFLGDATYNEPGVIGAVDLLSEWGGDRATETTYRFLETYRKGPHSPRTVESILGALARLDPQGLDARAAALGIAPGTIAAARSIAALRPLPAELVPRQLAKTASVVP